MRLVFFLLSSENSDTTADFAVEVKAFNVNMSASNSRRLNILHRLFLSMCLAQRGYDHPTFRKHFQHSYWSQILTQG
jgi:hypothetical protein